LKRAQQRVSKFTAYSRVAKIFEPTAKFASA